MACAADVTTVVGNGIASRTNGDASVARLSSPTVVEVGGIDGDLLFFAEAGGPGIRVVNLFTGTSRRLSPVTPHMLLCHVLWNTIHLCDTCCCQQAKSATFVATA